jgi:electron transfer flavoprotein beta subunit
LTRLSGLKNCNARKEEDVKILVTAKRVTDPDARIRLKSDMSGIDSEGVEYKLNPFCENAIEEALRLTAAHGGEVVAVAVGDARSVTEMRRALAMGCDRGILVEGTDENLDGDLVARVMAKVFEKETPDLFIFGKQAVDGDSNQVAQLCAEYLGLGQATFAAHPKGSAGMTGSEPGLAVADGKVTAMREVDGGVEVTEVALPAIVSADLRLNEPRLPTLPNIMKAKRKPLEQITMADLDVEETLKVKTIAYSNPPQRQAGIRVADVDELLNKLVNDAKVL